MNWILYLFTALVGYSVIYDVFHIGQPKRSINTRIKRLIEIGKSEDDAVHEAVEDYIHITEGDVWAGVIVFGILVLINLLS